MYYVATDPGQRVTDALKQLEFYSVDSTVCSFYSLTKRKPQQCSSVRIANREFEWRASKNAFKSNGPL